MAITRVLSGHHSKETAFVVADYPYGFRLRCKMRIWIEIKPGKGERIVSQTTNPKIEGKEAWNKEKVSTYDLVKVLYLDENNHVQNAAMPASTLLYNYDDESEKKMEEFFATYGAGFSDHAKEVWETTKKLRTNVRSKRAAHHADLGGAE